MLYLSASVNEYANSNQGWLIMLVKIYQYQLETKIKGQSNMPDMGSPAGSVVKSLPANAGNSSLIPSLWRSPGEGDGNPIQNSCLGNPMDRGDWQAAVHGVTKSWIWLSDKQQQKQQICLSGMGGPDFAHKQCISAFSVCGFFFFPPCSWSWVWQTVVHLYCNLVKLFLHPQGILLILIQMSLVILLRFGTRNLAI